MPHQPPPTAPTYLQNVMHGETTDAQKEQEKQEQMEQQMPRQQSASSGGVATITRFAAAKLR